MAKPSRDLELMSRTTTRTHPCLSALIRKNILR
jgi:hypothetical protein